MRRNILETWEPYVPIVLRPAGGQKEYFRVDVIHYPSARYLLPSSRTWEKTVPAHATCFSQTCWFVAAKISSDEKASDELGEFPELISKRG